MISTTKLIKIKEFFEKCKAGKSYVGYSNTKGIHKELTTVHNWIIHDTIRVTKSLCRTDWGVAGKY